MDIAFHTPLTQSHQFEHFEWFSEGFKHHGINIRRAESPSAKADYHIISGPHFAYHHMLGHPRVIMIDRAYWHPEKTGKWQSMDWISIGWLQPDGTRNFRIGSGRKPPIVKDRPLHGGTIFLADHNGPVEKADTVRIHPAGGRSEEPLIDALRRHRTAIGYRTSALVTAALEGLETICKDKRNILAKSNWLEILPYADWHFSEIQSGEAVEHLLYDFDNRN